jgi:ketosteroid isomerase-like protein
MKMHLRSLLFLLAGLAPAALVTHAQEAATDETAKPSTQLQTMQKLEDTWSTALAKRDQYGLELVLSPQFVNISADGDVRSRNQEIAFVLNKFPDMISLEQTVVSVRTMGDVALVNGTYVLQRRANGKPVDERGVFSHVFQKTRSNWQCINAQRTIVQEEAVAKAKAASAKTSNAELPFHIPLFHKGADPAPPAQTQSQMPTNSSQTPTNSATETQPANPQQ